MKVNVINGELDIHEINEYIKYGQQKYKGRQISRLDITLDGEFVDLKFYFKDTDFQHAYRSADYLVNTMDKLNDAKQAEFSQKQRHPAVETIK
ncbi:MAG: hypothetical protein PUA81_02570 [Oscillospiraceae bacterium]|nr:hypothetical protein [Oscillospiraceae bacterium]